MHKKSRFTFGVIVLALLSVGAAFTLHSQEQDGQKQNQASSVSDGKIKVCDNQKADLDTYFCEVENWRIFEKRMDQQIQTLLASIHSYWNEEADQEIKNRIIATQKSWLQYRKGQCTQNYYSKAPISSGSDSLKSILCTISKTKERIKELELSAQ